MSKNFYIHVIFLLVLNSFLFAQESIVFSNYGPSASTQEGDDDFYSVYYIRIPEDRNNKIYLRIFDMDCGGAVDQQFGNWDTQTRFTLYNKGFAHTFQNISSPVFELQTLEEGNVIYDNVVGWAEEYDNRWYTFAEIIPQNGLHINGSYLFKLAVQTKYGDDGNLYSLFLSSSSSDNIPTNNAQIFFYKTTFRLLDNIRLGYFKLMNNSAEWITVNNFDGDGSPLRLHTPFRSNVRLSTSPQNTWVSDKILFDDFEDNKDKVIQFYGKEAGPNDITFYVTDNNYRAVPLIWEINHALQNKRPVLKYSCTVNNSGLDYIFTCRDSYDQDGDNIDYTWLIDGQIISNDKNFNYTFPSPGSYNLSLIGLDNSGSPENGSIKDFDVIVNEKPVAIAGTNIYSTKTDINFDATKSYDNGGSISRYQWIFGDRDKNNKAITSHSYSSPGIYRAILNVWDNSNSPNNNASDTIEVVINAKPISDAGPDIISYPGQVINLSGNNSVDPDGSITKYEWLLDNSIKSGKDISLNFDKPGNFKITLRVFDDSGHPEAYDDDEMNITINAEPKAIIKAPKIVSPNEFILISSSYSFDPDGTLAWREWSINDFKSKDADIKYKFSSPGFYDIKLRVKDNRNQRNSINETVFTIKVNSPPVPIVEYDETSCDTYLTFDASESIDNDGDNMYFVWDFGDGEKKPGKTVGHNFKESGTYPITLTVDDGQKAANSVVVNSFKVQINHPPVADAGNDEIACVGRTIFFSGVNSSDLEGGALKYDWDFGDGTYAQGMNVTKAYENSGIYQVTLTTTDNSGLPCNYDIDTKLIKVVEAPVANAGQDLIGCTNNPVKFDGSLSTDTDGIVNNYEWDFGDGTTGGGVYPQHIYLDEGVYTVTLTVTGEYSGECSNVDTDQLQVTISSAIKLGINSPDSISINEPVSFSADTDKPLNSSETLYNWYINGHEEISSNTFIKTFDKPGTYKVELSLNPNNDSRCEALFSSKTIYVNSPPVANAGKDVETFEGHLVNLDASKSFDDGGKISYYIWKFEDGSIMEGVHISCVFNTPGGYTVKLIVVDDTMLNSNSSEDDVFILVHPY